MARRINETNNPKKVFCWLCIECVDSYPSQGRYKIQGGAVFGMSSQAWAAACIVSFEARCSVPEFMLALPSK